MKTYLVTGAAGFIGANYLKYILNKYKNDVYNKFKNVINSDNAHNIWDNISSFFENIWKSITNFFGNLGNSNENN